jgi:hypothetical protein
MSKKATSHAGAELRCGALPRVRVGHYSIYEVELAPTEPGWYAWFYVPDSLEDIRHELLRMSGVRANVKGLMGLEYEGDLAPVQQATPVLDERDLVALQRAMLAFSPPLYIGIATCLRDRLLQHRTRVQDAVAANDFDFDAGNVEPDTVEESAFFGERVGQFIARTGISPASLYVKCVTADDSDALKRIETTLNRMFGPVFGRRA